MGEETKNRSGDAIVAKDVKARKVEWLWQERIPKGFISIVAGRPDQGKGLFAAHVAADVTNMGGNVLYSAIEDDHGLMTRPRLEAAGADLSRVLLWRFELPRQFDEMAKNVIDHDIRLVVMDPFNAHLVGVSRHSDSIRKVTNPLSELAETTNCSILVVEHALKRVSKKAHPLSGIGGNSSGLPAASRAAFIFGVNPDDSEKRMLCTAKLNLRSKPPALEFESDTEEVGLIGEIPYLVLQGETEFDAIKLLADGGEPGKVGRPPDKRAAAAEWLSTYLFAAHKCKPVKAGTVLEDAKQNGMTNKTTRRAADDMGVIRTPPGGGPKCVWELPDDVKKKMSS